MFGSRIVVPKIPAATPGSKLVTESVVPITMVEEDEADEVNEEDVEEEDEVGVRFSERAANPATATITTIITTTPMAKPRLIAYLA